MVELLTLLAGAGGTVTSATLPLNINSGALCLDANGFCTSASSPLSLRGGQMTIDLPSYSATTQMNAAVAAGLAPYVLTSTLGPIPLQPKSTLQSQMRSQPTSQTLR